MKKKTVTQIGNKLIHTKLKAVKDVQSPKTKKIIKDLTVAMRHHDLIGIAANQIGINARVFVTEIRKTKIRRKKDDPVRVFINPGIIWQSKKKVWIYEGCGSVAEAGLFAPVKRSQKVTVKAYNEYGEVFTVKAEGLLARVILHEIGHLNGQTFLEEVADPRTYMSRNEYMKVKDK